ncbi:thyroid hormone receptor interactor 4 [Trypanosoma grayi]|uniref:thyroid hormone receptor interactor 4 n=1 Tax=Trypanosoma grayi TaxID=71804 RepID=UPI0004F43066|nr:thyroid hormone receptor interactor 4 [Trypanosoma grayi]KEG07360.1 thyroid hormone receptor interactor 4 [Trypanosoma grayi]
MRSPAEAQKDALVHYIRKEIEDNNLLGLVGEELDGMADMLATCGVRREVYDWCQTLVGGEVLAAEVLRRRDDNGPPFDDTPAAKKTSPAAAAVTGTSGGGGGGGRQLNVAGKKGSKRKGTSLAKAAGGGATALKPGLFECGCFATGHNLRGNCANCGRIICEQESDEMCYSCGLDPSICVAYEVKVQEGLLSAAALEKNRNNYEATIAKRDELLQYAETRAKRTKVIDDQAAVFLSPKHAWMSVAERDQADEDEALAERRRKVAAMHRATGAYMVHLDIMKQNVSLSRQDMLPTPHGSSSSAASKCDAEEEVSAEDEEQDEETRALPLPTLMQKIWYSLDGSTDAVSTAATATATPASLIGTAGGAAAAAANVGEAMRKPKVHRVVEVSRRVQQDYYEDDLQFFMTAQREGQGEYARIGPDGLEAVDDKVSGDEDENKGAAIEAAAATSGVIDRFAPTPTMRMNDDGVCLSMHQPWAGLLVAGVKRHEGRAWSTDYRGRLWIHAASAQPHEVAEVEQHYAQFMKPTQKLPQHYPTRVLLGYVYITDCMDRDTYVQTFSEDERQEASPFMFICAEAKALPFPLPMEGNHKLFRLDHKVHTAAKKQLMEIV